jgi:tetraacyldisaccharide 4'-kinase
MERLWYQRFSWRHAGLVPLTWIFSCAVWLKNTAFDLGLLRPEKIPGAFVISVGNLIVGGSGKTPLVILLSQRAIAAGKKVAVLTRGYGRSSAQLVAFDAMALPRVEECGDEALLLAKSVPLLKMYVCADRVKAALAARADGFDFLIMDDGFQHRRLHRDVDLVVDSNRGNGWRMPVGPLRESPKALARADVRIGDQHEVRVHSEIQLPIQKTEVILVTGIARPDRVVDALKSIGVRVAKHFEFADHHSFSAAEMQRIKYEADLLGLPIVTTGKDAQRLHGLDFHIIEHAVKITHGIEILSKALQLPIP